MMNQKQSFTRAQIGLALGMLAGFFFLFGLFFPANFNAKDSIFWIAIGISFAVSLTLALSTKSGKNGQQCDR